GFLRTEKAYTTHYVLKLEYRRTATEEKPGIAGYIGLEESGSDDYLRTILVSLYNDGHAAARSIQEKGPRAPQPQMKENRKGTARPDNEWNQLFIAQTGDGYELAINGEPVGKINCAPQKGHIALIPGEGILLRNIAIKEVV